MSHSRARSSHSATIAVPDEAFSRALARIKGQTKSERVQSLKDAGILTPSGNYAKPYQMLAVGKRVA